MVGASQSHSKTSGICNEGPRGEVLTHTRAAQNDHSSVASTLFTTYL